MISRIVKSFIVLPNAPGRRDKGVYISGGWNKWYSEVDDMDMITESLFLSGYLLASEFLLI